MTAAAFPGGTSISRLRVYGGATGGHGGGTPHMHTVSTEAYIVTAGAGELQSIDRKGFHSLALCAGDVVWFGAGTIHRAVNFGGLELAVIMSNAGLPEAGDAVMTFPARVLDDLEAYRVAAQLPDARVDRTATAEAANRRRELAMQGFDTLREAALAGDPTALERFYGAAVRLVEAKVDAWRDLWRGRVVDDANRTGSLLDDLAAGRSDNLGLDGARSAEPSGGERHFGMCGLLRSYGVGA